MERSSTFSSHTASSHTAPPQAHPERPSAAQLFGAAQDRAAHPSGGHGLLGSIFLKMAEVDQEEQALWQGRFLRITEALRPAAEAPPSSASTSRILQEELRSPAAQRPGTVRDRGARRAGNHCLLNSLFLTMGEVDQEEQAFWQGHVLPVAEALRPL